VRGAEAFAGVAVEVLVEGDQVAEVPVGLQDRIVAEHGAPPVGPAQEQPREPAGELVRDLGQGLEPVRAGGELRAERLAVEALELVEGLDEHDVERHPDGAAPVRVAAEELRHGLARLVVHDEPRARVLEREGLRRVRLRDRADAVRGEELRLVQHAPQRGLHAVAPQKREQEPIALARLGPARDQPREVGAVAQQPGGARREAEEAPQRADVVETEEAALEDVAPFGSALV
jgi:hypothetical protein